MGVGFPSVVGRREGTREAITPRRTIAVALLTFGAAYATFPASQIANQPWLPWYGGELKHGLWHLFWAVLALAVAFALHRFRRAWPATGWTGRCLAAAEPLAFGVAAGNVLAGVGVFIWIAFPPHRHTGGWDWRYDYIFIIHPHNVGEVLGIGSLAILLFVCLVMLGVGIRGALRPTAQPT
jgi:hypothetical protein